MEGAGSIITELADGWVRKTQKRSAKRGERNHITIQWSLQNWSFHHLTPENGYTVLFTPEPRPCTDSSTTGSYEMRMIDTSKDPLFLNGIPQALWGEVKKFMEEFKKATGYTLYDVEFYVQPDGRVAVLDFDQCFVASAK